MNATDLAQRYLAAWNRRDPAAIVSLFEEGGLYSDPASGEIRGQAIADYTGGLFAAFPDLNFEVESFGQAGERTVAFQWRMRGTNTGSFHGLPPSGKAVDVPGADFLVAGDTGIRALHGYFNPGAVPRQLGMDVVVQPKSVGPVAFGTSANMSGIRNVKPGAISLTSLHVRSDSEVEEVRAYARQIYREIGSMPGFISLLSATAGTHMMTVSAWESPEQPRQMYQNAVHKEALQRMTKENLALSGTSSVWIPASFGRLRVRCGECSAIADYEAVAGRCACGAQLPDPPPYW